MRNPDTMELRRLLVQLPLGQPETITMDGMEAAEVKKIVLRAARLKSLPIKISDVQDGVLIERVNEWPEPSIYDSIDALAIGASYLFKLPPATHQRIRVAASSRSRTHQVALTCSRDGDFLRVTRLPLTEAEAAACGPIAMPARVSKWPMDGLARGERLTFTVALAEHHKLRLAVTKKGKVMGWSIRCRIQDDGTMLVYRTDSGAEQATMQAAADSVTAGSIEA